MSLDKIRRVFSMDRYGRNSIRLGLKLANSIMGMAGIAILMYSLWIIGVCLRKYKKHHFPWFLYACIGIGAIFCFTACIGHAAAKRRRRCLRSLYIVIVFLLLLAEILIIADVLLNDDWDKDFPEDHTDRFDDFVDFVDDYKEIFGFLAFLMLFSQALSFTLAMVLRTTHHSFLSFHEHGHDHHNPAHAHGGVPHVFGHPIFPHHTKGLGETLLGR